MANPAPARTQEERVITLGPGLAPIPERLLLAHAKGKVLFLAGAGISLPANLPDFRDLVVRVYGRLDPMVHSIIRDIPRTACNQWLPSLTGLNDQQAAEVKRFISGDFDVVLGMLERRFDRPDAERIRVREEVRSQLLHRGIKPAGIHKTLVRLADRGGATAIATTNFDLLFEDAAKQMRVDVQSYSLGSIPRPGLRRDFAGIFHIHGALEKDIKKISDLILTDRDFGEFYLRRRVVPDFIYDAARLYHLVLVGYSANDPPMRYLLNAVAADGTRFNDLKERFTFFSTGSLDPVAMEDWKGRGITPIHYPANGANHSALLNTLRKWADLSAINGKASAIHALLKRIVKEKREDAPEIDCDLFDHLVRRSSPQERLNIACMISQQKADASWLDAIISISSEHEKEKMA